jgi:putative ABC transport system permease protein
MISYELWRRRYGGDPQIVGREIEVNNFSATVLGVMPQGFKLHLGPGVNLPEQIDLYYPGAFNDNNLGTGRGDHSLTTVARLKPGVTFAQAQNEIDSIAANLAREYPQVYDGGNVRFHLSPLHQDLVQKARPTILALLGAVGFTLLIACANVANLILARADARTKELAIRRALGASRSRIIRQVANDAGGCQCGTERKRATVIARAQLDERIRRAAIVRNALRLDFDRLAGGAGSRALRRRAIQRHLIHGKPAYA